MAGNLELLKSLSLKFFRSGVQSVLPHALIKNHVQREGSNLTVLGNRYLLKRNCYLVGFGKAVLGMSSELERILGEHLVTGVISVPEGIQNTFRRNEDMLPKPCSVLRVLEGARNNMPDTNAKKAAECIASLIKDLDSSAILFVAVSGGGSSLLPSPIPPISLSDKLIVTKLLSTSGASINELNTVRKSLSYLKGGGLAMLGYPAQVIALILSDIVDDPLDSIASGPTVVNTDSVWAPIHILKKYSLEDKIPRVVLDYLNKRSDSKVTSVEIPIRNGQFCHVHNCVIGNNISALENVAKQAQNDGYTPLIFSSSIEGNVRKVSKLYSSFAMEMCKFVCCEISRESFLENLKSACKSVNISTQNLLKLTEFNTPVDCKRICIISGGETTVEVTGNGLGGRNQELSLSFAWEVTEAMKSNSCCQHCNILFLSGGTDGIDGPTNYAGAISYPQQIDLSARKRIDPLSYLNNNDSTNFYLDLNNGEDLINIGHTGTNVMDIHMLIVEMFKK